MESLELYRITQRGKDIVKHYLSDKQLDNGVYMFPQNRCFTIYGTGGTFNFRGVGITDDRVFAYGDAIPMTLSAFALVVDLLSLDIDIYIKNL